MNVNNKSLEPYNVIYVTYYSWLHNSTQQQVGFSRGALIEAFNNRMQISQLTCFLK